MPGPISPRDLERLSAFLDNQLPAGERNRLQARLLAEPELKAALEGLRRTRAVLRAAPRARAPRSFRLTPDMAARPAASPWFPALRLTSVVAAFLLAALVTGEFAAARLGAIPLPFGAAAPLYAREPAVEAQAPAPEAMEEAADSAAAGAEPAEGEMTLMAATETPAAALELAAPVEEATAGAAAAAEEAEESEFRAAEETIRFSPLRLAELALAGLALASGLAAWRLRRR